MPQTFSVIKYMADILYETPSLPFDKECVKPEIQWMVSQDDDDDDDVFNKP